MYKNNIITLFNETKYIVLEEINYENNNYLLVLNSKNEDDIKIVKLVSVNDEEVIETFIPPIIKTNLSLLFKDKLNK